jgi:hypothetical protein
LFTPLIVHKLKVRQWSVVRLNILLVVVTSKSCPSSGLRPKIAAMHMYPQEIAVTTQKSVT